MDRKIIAITGIACAGKDTAANIIKETNENTDIFSFAGPLKDACKILFNLSQAQLHDPVVKEEHDDRWNRSPREIFQWLGTDILREQINKDFFIMNMQQRIESSKADYIIISDVRFENESKFIRSLGGKIIKIIRPDAKTTKHNNHITEQGIPDNLVDAVILNSDSIEEFKKTVLVTIRLLCKDHVQ
jgi:hypothetical protein